MIGKLKGVIDSIQEHSVIIDVGGVGYETHCSAQTIRALKGVGQPAELRITTHVREDHIHLYGFKNAAEQQCFLTLTKISGVGTKVALAILSALSPNEITQAITLQDKTPFTSISGIGPKLANRIITELKDKWSLSGEELETLVKSGGTASKEAVPDTLSDAIMALVQLGYQRADAYKAVTKIAQNDNVDNVSVLIKEALKQLSTS